GDAPPGEARRKPGNVRSSAYPHAGRRVSVSAERAGRSRSQAAGRVARFAASWRIGSTANESARHEPCCRRDAGRLLPRGGWRAVAGRFTFGHARCAQRTAAAAVTLEPFGDVCPRPWAAWNRMDVAEAKTLIVAALCFLLCCRRAMLLVRRS